MSNIYSGEIDNCNFRGARVSGVLTPQFPFEATIKNIWKRFYSCKFKKYETILSYISNSPDIV